MTKNEYVEKLKELYGNKYELKTDLENYTNRDYVNILCNGCGCIKEHVSVRHSIRNGTLECQTCHDKIYATELIDRLNSENPNEWTNVSYSHGKYTTMHKCGGIKISPNISAFIYSKSCQNCGKGSQMKNLFVQIQKSHPSMSYKISGRKLTICCQKGHEYTTDILNYAQCKRECKICGGYDEVTLESYKKEFSKKENTSLYNILRLEDRNSLKNRTVVYQFIPYGNTEFKISRNDLLKNKANIERSYISFIKNKNDLESLLNCKLLTTFKQYYDGNSDNFKSSMLSIYKYQTNEIVKIKYNRNYNEWLDYNENHFSYGILTIFKKLNDIGIYFNKEYKVNISNNSIGRFDIYIPEYNLFIEYDGEQHFKNSFYNISKYGNHSMLKAFERDQLKNEYCIENGTDLLRISYLSNNQEISDIIEDLFTKGIYYVTKKYKNTYSIINRIEHHLNNYYVRVRNYLYNNLAEMLLNCSGNSLESKALKD